MTKEIKIEYSDDGWTGDIHPKIDPGQTTTLSIDWADKAIIIKETPIFISPVQNKN